MPHAIQGAQRQINSLLLYTPKIGWINDPNGLVYANGIYHMFYQNNPYGNTAANISWGHAISRDLVHWEDKGIALRYNQSTQEAMFSGSAVFDEQNTSGFGTQDHPPLVAIYAAYYPVGATLADGTQLEPATQAISMAYSTDGGENWHFYENNPAVRKPPTPYVDQYKDFRDPKVTVITFIHGRFEPTIRDARYGNQCLEFRKFGRLVTFFEKLMKNSIN